MRIHWLQHADFEGLGSLEPTLEARGHVLTGSCLHRGDCLPPLADFDALIILGGPMSVDQDEAYPWLRPEKALIRAALAQHRRTLGICLGAQLLAEALGGSVVRNAELEIGWFPLMLTAEGLADPLMAGLPPRFTSFHWHGDTYRLPPGAIPLAASAACTQQAFSWDEGRVLGLQFHPEVTLAQAREWLRDEAVTPARWVQSAESIVADQAAFLANRSLAHTLLDNWLSR